MGDMESPAGRARDASLGRLLLPLHCGLDYLDGQV